MRMTRMLNYGLIGIMVSIGLLGCTRDLPARKEIIYQSVEVDRPVPVSGKRIHLGARPELEKTYSTSDSEIARAALINVKLLQAYSESLEVKILEHNKAVTVGGKE